MKKISLRMRLTLTTILIISAIAVMLTLVSMYNANIAISSVAVDPALDDASYDSYFSYGSTAAAPASTENPSAEYNAEEAGFFERVTPASEVFSLPGERPPNQGSSSILSITPVTTMTIGMFNMSSILYMLIIIAAGGVFTYFALGRALRPVRLLSDEISGITENELAVRIEDFNAGDEMTKLADSFNTMLERLERAFSVQKEFAAAAAHELKTPLSAIKANIDVLHMDELPTIDEYRDTIQVAEKQTARMSLLVDDLLAMSNGREYELNDAVDIGALTKEILSDLSHAVRANKLTVNIKNTYEGNVYANAQMLRRALTNIIENAVKYNRPGGSIDISISGLDNTLDYCVSDTGIGIGEEHLPHIFEPFYRADSSRSRKVGGAGLGLAISQEIIHKHGGKITASQNAEGGTDFRIKLKQHAKNAAVN